MMNNADELWNKCLRIIKDIVPEAAYQTWFEPIVPVKYENDEFLLQVPSTFFYEYIEEKFADLLRFTLNREVGEGTKLLYRIMIDQSSKKTTVLPTANNDVTATQTPKVLSVNSVTSPFNKYVQQDIDPRLNPIFNFNNFVEGSSNKLARTAGISIANDPGKTIFNPIFIYGQSGVGKTHLANAIGLMTKQLHPEKRVLYVSANLFQIQYTDAVTRYNSQNDFLNFYQSIDVLIIDDIQELINKPGTQNTFFHIFNHLHQLGKQLILCSDRAPGMMKGMEDRLITRFKWGLVTEIEKPNFELRKAILKYKIFKDGLEISDDVIDYIAENVQENIRDIEGVLISLLAHSTLTNDAINIDLAKKVIGNVTSLTPRKITVEKIRDVVCEYFAVSCDDLQSKTRSRQIAEPRQIAMYLARQHTDTALATIGLTIGKRDHATVLHACKAVKNQMDTDKTFFNTIKDLEEKIKN